MLCSRGQGSHSGLQGFLCLWVRLVPKEKGDTKAHTAEVESFVELKINQMPPTPDHSEFRVQACRSLCKDTIQNPYMDDLRAILFPRTFGGAQLPCVALRGWHCSSGRSAAGSHGPRRLVSMGLHGLFLHSFQSLCLLWALQMGYGESKVCPNQKLMLPCVTQQLPRFGARSC